MTLPPETAPHPTAPDGPAAGGPAPQQPGPPRHPISRRIMVALFLLMTVPMIGWYFLGDFTARGLWDALPGSGREVILEVQRQVRFKLALVLGASIAALGAVILYLRRSVLDRLERLARRARSAGRGPWVPVDELAQPDEIGDLARALERARGRLEERAEEASRFAHNLSHELRTPLAAIRGAAELLTEPDLSAAQRERFTRHVLSESQRLERLVSGLLDLARVEGRRDGEAPPPQLDVVAAVDALVERFRALAAEAGVRLRVSRAPEVPQVAAHPDLLDRTLLPLIENALRHSPAGSEVWIRLERRPGAVLVAVEDRGPGVPEPLREKVFERGFTAVPAASAPAAGTPLTGLGLSIARRAAHRLGARLWVEEAPGGGARFVLAMAEGSRGDHGRAPEP